MKKRKAVVLYGSLTGNTEQVGRAFAEVLEEYGFETRCEKLVAGKDWSNDPVYFWDYDIVVLGSLIVAGLPYKEVYQLLGLQGNRTIMGKAMEPPKNGEPLNPEMNPMGGRDRLCTVRPRTGEKSGTKAEKTSLFSCKRLALSHSLWYICIC